MRGTGSAASIAATLVSGLLVAAQGLKMVVWMQAALLIGPRLISRIGPAAQALYGTGIGAASALVMVSSGALYAWLGGDAFWIMAMVCAIALPLTRRLARFSPLH